VECSSGNSRKKGFGQELSFKSFTKGG